MRFISWNVNGIRAMEKRGFTDLVLELSPDIFAVQETKAQPEQLSDELKNIPGYTSYWNSAEKKGYSGVAVYSRGEPLSVIYGMDNRQFDVEGRALTLEYDDFFLVNLYFPNAQPKLARIDYKIAFDETLKTFVQGLAEKKSVVLCGDFNVAHKPIDLANPKRNEANPGYSPQERAWMDRFIGDGWVDTFRMFVTEPGHYTWWSYRFGAREKNIGWRIDYFCVDKKSEKRVTNSFILKDIMGSDHCPLGLDFK